MSPGKSLLKLALGAAALAGIAGALALSPQALPRALADGPTPTPATPHYSFPSGINQAIPDPFVAPQLTNLELQPVVAPGGLVKVDGTNFGAERGNGGLCLEWTIVLVQNDFTKQQRLCLDVVDWSDTRVIAQVPRDVVGVPDQNAPVVLRTDGGAYSNTLPLQFVATRETRYIGSEPANVQISCSDGSSRDSCDANGGRHSDDFFISDGSNGTDFFTYHLANGWQFQSMSFFLMDGSAVESGTPQPGATNFTLRVDWSFGGFTTAANYNLNIVVTGPAGVPME